MKRSLVVLVGALLAHAGHAQVRTYIDDEPPVFNDPDAPIVCPSGSVKRTPANTFRQLDASRLAEATGTPPAGYVPARMLGPPPLKYPGNIFTRKPGFASVFVVLDAKGAPSEPQVVCSSHEKFERAALDAIMQARFAPGTQDGVAIEDVAIVPFDFKTR